MNYWEAICFGRSGLRGKEQVLALAPWQVGATAQEAGGWWDGLLLCLAVLGSDVSVSLR